MKKHYFFLVFFLGISLLGVSQTRYTAAILTDFDAGLTPNYSPIRNWNEKYSISFVRGANSYAFSLINHLPFFTVPPSFPLAFSSIHATFQSVEIADEIVVNDIYITDDKAFFSGSLFDEFSNAWCPFYGYLNLQDFFAGSVPIQFYLLYNLPLTPQLPSTLKRLVAFPNGNTYKVIAYGTEPNSCDKIVEIPDALSNAIFPTVYNLPTDPNSSEKMTIDDMAMNGSYVFFSGHYNAIPGSPVIWYGCCDRMNLSSLSSNTRTLSTYEQPNATVICTSIPSGTALFALAYTFFDENEGPCYTRLRVIDGTSHTNTHSQQFKKPRKYPPRRMTYLHDIDAIELVQENMQCTDFYSLMPFMSQSYTSLVFETPDYYFYNIDTVGGHHFISSDCHHFCLHDRTMSMPPSTEGCPKYVKIPVDIIPNVNTSPHPLSINYNFVAYPISKVAPVVRDNMRTECYSYENLK